MSRDPRSATIGVPHTLGAGYLFGVPLGDLGWFASLLIGLASGFVAFFLATFLAIVAFLVLNSSRQTKLDYSLTYRHIGFPAGVIVGALALLYLGSLWIKRHLRRA